MSAQGTKVVLTLILALSLAACDSSGSSSDDPDDNNVTPTPGPTAAGQIRFTEIMPDPNTVTDILGEWFEVRNFGSETLSLRDCVVMDALTNNFLINLDLEIGVGEYRTFAINAMPGFTPDFDYMSAFLLLDTGDTLTLTCNGVTIDSYTYPPTVSSGDSWSLSSDDNTRWCSDTVNLYNGDTGTPGAVNLVCP